MLDKILFLAVFSFDHLKSLFRIVFTVCLISALSACSTNIPKKAEIIVQVEEPARIRFSGKGAGAGMMLSSSMGPMGVAIGVAIDEGIAKDINENAVQGGFAIEEILVNAFQPAGRDLGITVKRYGFVLARGDFPEDSVFPELDLEIQMAGAEPMAYRFPHVAESAKSEEVLQVWSLQAIKTQSHAVTEAFAYAAGQLAKIAIH